MKFGILRDKFKLKKFQSLYFVFEYWFRDIKSLIEGTHGISKLKLNFSPQYLVCLGHTYMVLIGQYLPMLECKQSQIHVCQIF